MHKRAYATVLAASGAVALLVSGCGGSTPSGGSTGAAAPASTTSTTTAAAGTNSGVHEGSVMGATRTSPGSSRVGSLLSSTTRAVPSTTPQHPGRPTIVSPAPSS